MAFAFKSEISQTERQILCDFTYMQTTEQMDKCNKTETVLWMQRTNRHCQRNGNEEQEGSR